jgi:predicted metal-dependent enzyme (double-stranded beta helix superfamily)
MRGEFFVQEPGVLAFIGEVHSVLEHESDIRKRLARMRSPYRNLLDDKSWLPEAYRQINPESGMGGGIASWLLYQNLEKDPYNDVHRVKTISPEPSISLHLLANDTGCVVRQKFDPVTGQVDTFRSGWSNRPCPETAAEGD